MFYFADRATSLVPKSSPSTWPRWGGRIKPQETKNNRKRFLTLP